MFTVRPAESRDADAAVDVVRRSITELCTDDHRGDAETLAGWLANKTAQHFVTWLANEEKRVVLQINTGKYFREGVDLHETLQRHVLYTNTHVLAADPIQMAYTELAYARLEKAMMGRLLGLEKAMMGRLLGLEDAMAGRHEQLENTMTGRFDLLDSKLDQVLAILPMPRRRKRP